MFSDGVKVCSKCYATLIEEERSKHRHSLPYKLKGDILWVRREDGKWYKHILPSPEIDRRFSSPEDLTEPVKPP